MNPLPSTDRRHFDAAQGSLTLGDWRSANDELENIAPLFRDAIRDSGQEKSAWMREALLNAARRKKDR